MSGIGQETNQQDTGGEATQTGRGSYIVKRVCGGDVCGRQSFENLDLWGIFARSRNFSYSFDTFGKFGILKRATF